MLTGGMLQSCAVTDGFGAGLPFALPLAVAAAAGGAPHRVVPTRMLDGRLSHRRTSAAGLTLLEKRLIAAPIPWA